MSKDLVIKGDVINRLLNILLNIAGSSMLAFGICAFVEPYHLIAGGATGIALLIHQLTGLGVSLIALAINLIVLPIGYFFGSRKLVLGSLLSSLIYPAALAVFERIPEITTIADSSIMATVCGGVVCGAGIGLVMKSGGSTGGIDIPVIILAKLLHQPVASVMNLVDSGIMCLQVPFSGFTNLIYGLMFTYLLTRSLNHILTWGEDRLKVTIISEQFHDVRWALLDNDYGCTMIHAEGGYTKTPLMKIESVMVANRYREAQKIIEAVDPEAFVLVERVKDVRGKGYTLEREAIERSWDK